MLIWENRKYKKRITKLFSIDGGTNIIYSKFLPYNLQDNLQSSGQYGTLAIKHSVIRFDLI